MSRGRSGPSHGPVSASAFRLVLGRRRYRSTAVPLALACTCMSDLHGQACTCMAGSTSVVDWRG
ncbi:hypothetical protein K469DRAFT_303377 [Zopfia rhizophila CBS 207.26]|uniref:Uncharacterized protein n=1 Tax=Zopfia rhizophila CBS 207.26 TaxID=1314779 RepID=A0A6A6DJX6_9PEZI|nr:hypothetical protein K469DRAFT_303377 [Zopfia rhizophila CBS 207.26]